MYTFVKVLLTIKKTTVLMAAVLAVATVLAAGLAILPDTVQNVEANPCAVDQTGGGGDEDSTTEIDTTCEVFGNVEVEEGPGGG